MRSPIRHKDATRTSERTSPASVSQRSADAALAGSSHADQLMLRRAVTHQAPTAGALLRAQRQAGNRAVQRLVAGTAGSPVRVQRFSDEEYQARAGWVWERKGSPQNQDQAGRDADWQQARHELESEGEHNRTDRVARAVWQRKGMPANQDQAAQAQDWSDAQAVVALLPGCTGQDMADVLGWLAPLTVADSITLLEALKADGVNGPDTRGFVERLRQPPHGLDGAAIQATVLRLRGNLSTLATPGVTAQELMPITDTIAPLISGQVDPTRAGTKRLEAGQIVKLTQAHLGGGLGAAQLGDHYPNGQPVPAAAPQLWLHLSPGAQFPGETNEHIDVRRRLALARLKTVGGYLPNNVQAIFNESSGQAPRPFGSVQTEDGLGLGGHIVDRHVLNGAGTIPDKVALAGRVVKNAPPCPHKAGAFLSVAQADGIVAALNAHLAANWATARDRLARGLPITGIPLFPCAVGEVLEVGWPPLGIGGWNTGAHAMLGGRPTWAAGPKPVAAPVAPPPPPLTYDVAPTNLFVRVVTHPMAPGCWYVNSAWPQ